MVVTMEAACGHRRRSGKRAVELLKENTWNNTMECRPAINQLVVTDIKTTFL
jgi:hypothetical protein